MILHNCPCLLWGNPISNKKILSCFDIIDYVNEGDIQEGSDPPNWVSVWMPEHAQANHQFHLVVRLAHDQCRHGWCKRKNLKPKGDFKLWCCVLLRLLQAHLETQWRSSPQSTAGIYKFPKNQLRAIRLRGKKRAPSRHSFWANMRCAIMSALSDRKQREAAWRQLSWAKTTSHLKASRFDHVDPWFLYTASYLQSKQSGTQTRT